MQRQDIREPFASLWRNKDIFDAAFHLEGQVFRNVKNRKTIRFVQDGVPFFVKLHKGVGWREIFKNLLQFKRPVLGAANEYDAIRKLESLGIETMNIRAFAERGFNPAGRESFLVTDELSGRVNLEDFTRTWRESPPDSLAKHKLIAELANICSGMHFSGLNHRDCYLCHFLLDSARFAETGEVSLAVLDLHRAEIRPVIPRRMRVKDLSGIFFSSFDLGLGMRDALRFIAVYRRGESLDSRIWNDVFRAAKRLYRKEFDREVPAFRPFSGL